MSQPLRIAQVAPPMERVPPHAYGGTERIIHELVARARPARPRGHDLCQRRLGGAGRHIATVPEALRPAGYTRRSAPVLHLTMREVLDRADEFDVIHSHLEWAGLLLARISPIPVVSTFHGRLDLPWADRAFARPAGRPGRHQRRTRRRPTPMSPWAASSTTG